MCIVLYFFHKISCNFGFSIVLCLFLVVYLCFKFYVILGLVVVRITSVHLILAIVAHMDLELYQMDVKTAFLNGELDEEIYMDQPLCFESKRRAQSMQAQNIHIWS